MTRAQFIRRVIILTCHCLRNFAFYKAGWKNKKPLINEQFFINANNNFLDIGIMEWCKLFADKKGKHHWKKIVTDKNSFFEGLLFELKCTEEELSDYTNVIKEYRDKFIAHLDLENTAHLPISEKAELSACYLYSYILNVEDTMFCIPEAPRDPKDFYNLHFNAGQKAIIKYKNTT